MHSTQPESSGRSPLAAVPLAVAYGALPLGYGMARLAGDAGAVLPTLPWLLLAGLGTLVTMYRPAPGRPASFTSLLFKGALFTLLVAGLIIFQPELVAAFRLYFPYMKELSPVVFLLFCGLWAVCCGLPDRADFQRFGALLGVLCIIDVVVEVVFYQAVPTIRWIGNADVLAGLLLVSQTASLKPGGNEGGVHEPDQGHHVWRVLVLLGLLACVSRTGLFASAWLALCFGRGPFRFRAIYAAVCLALLVGSFFLPATASDAVRYTDYWLWVEALRLYTDTPSLLFTGFAIGSPLPVEFPSGMGAIWQAATGTSSVFGAHLSQIPSFWLRLVMGWGLGVPLLLLTIVFILLLRRLTRMGAGLVAALFAQGMTTPLLFDPAMAVVIGLAFILAFSAPSFRPNTRKETAEEEDAPSPEPETDPVEEWGLRPL